MVAAGAVLSYALSTAIITACGAVALAYDPLATAATGRTLSSGRLKWLAGRLRFSTPAAEAEEPATLYLVPRLMGAARPLPAPPLVTVATDNAPARHSAAV